jgi:hypothetical protein
MSGYHSSHAVGRNFGESQPGDQLRSRRAWGEHHNQVAGAIHRVGDPTLPHKLGLADKSVVSRNTRSAFSWPTRRAMRCNPF